MKANENQIRQALDRPDPATRLYLLYGPDEAAARALVLRLARALGPAAERIELDQGALKADPARLADEAAAISMFGDSRYIVVTLDTGDAALPAIEALLSAPAAGNPVVVLAGNLRATHALVKLALSRSEAMCFACYPLEGEKAVGLVQSIARELGLRIPAELARVLAARSGHDRAIMTQELTKFALYLDAAADRPAELDHATFDLLSAGDGEAALGPLVDAVFDGDGARLEGELARLSSVGIDGIPMVRALLRRAMALAPLSAAVSGGQSFDAVMEGQGKHIFFKDKPAFRRQLRLWSPARIERVIARLIEAERAIKGSRTAGPVLASQMLAETALKIGRRR